MVIRFMLRLIDRLVAPRLYACRECPVRGIMLPDMLLHAKTTQHAFGQERETPA